MRWSLTLGIVALTALAAGSGWGRDGDDAKNGVGQIRIGVPNANPAVGTEPNILDPEFVARLVATGTDPIENPSGVITKFGLLSTGVPTEPDQNTYLVLDRDPGGPAAGFDYGRHFLIQGHENAGNLAYVTRINLDVTDAAHRITLLTPVGANGLTGFNALDGSTFDPFTGTLLFTQENGANGGVVEISMTWPPKVTQLDGILGRGGYEGIHPDDKGNIYIAEDVGGTSVNVVPGDPKSAKTARQPNSFMYRFIPYDPTRLEKGGKLQALQVTVDGTPITFHANDPVGDVFNPAQLKLHLHGAPWPAKWVTVNDTGLLDPNAPQPPAFSANQKAKDAGATPFKRPENFSWLPGSNFRTLFFDETGDTDATAGAVPELAARGSWGSIFRVDMGDNSGPGGKGDDEDGPSDKATVSLFALGDADHASFDNTTFANENQLLVAEDRGDTLHDQLNKLDSVWAYDVKSGNAVRFLALGRDPISAPAGAEDNEPTGVFVSNGSADKKQLVGTKDNLKGARGFFTEQHGQNNLFEFLNVK